VAAALLERITDRTINAGERLPGKSSWHASSACTAARCARHCAELESNGVLKRERGSSS
jgi:DNA-binding transcriptional MocR family regulator